MSYKRNQIEEAIVRIFYPNRQKPPSELRTHIKRLLELDRSMGRKVRSRNAEEAKFAFFSEKAPGRGADISFSEYEAFALLNGLGIMDHGWTQSSAVSIMRRVRRDLEREHARILRQDPDKLFDWEAIRARARPGDIGADNTDPVYLTVASKAQHVSDEGQRALSSVVWRGFESVSKFRHQVGASSVTMFEVATLTHSLHTELMKTAPIPRGRGSSRMRRRSRPGTRSCSPESGTEHSSTSTRHFPLASSRIRSTLRRARSAS
jgi:hypothetical protein